jgi:hypothetical protein
MDKHLKIKFKTIYDPRIQRHPYLRDSKVNLINPISNSKLKQLRSRKQYDQTQEKTKSRQNMDKSDIKNKKSHSKSHKKR